MIRSPRYERPLKRIPASFFRLESGREPVREWLRSDALSSDDRLRIGEDIRTLERGWSIGMRPCRSLGGGLWEVRTALERRDARVIFCLHQGRLILLHGFIKKTKKTPLPDLRLAAERKRQLENDA